MGTTNDNVGKCGHPRCAGGDGTHCYEKGKPMRAYKSMTREDLAERKTEHQCYDCTWRSTLEDFIHHTFDNKRRYQCPNCHCKRKPVLPC